MSRIRYSPFWLKLTAIALLGIFQALARRWGHSLTIDEPFTANLVHKSWPQMFDAFYYETPAPLHYLLLKPFVFLLGESELALRSFSLICFGLSVVIVGMAARHLSNTRGGLIAALLFSISDIGLAFGATARMYALLALNVSLATLIFFRLTEISASDDPPRSERSLMLFYVLLIGTNVTGIMTHPIYFFFILAYLTAALVHSPPKFRILTICSIVSAIIYLMIYGKILYHTISLPTTCWMKIPGFDTLAEGLLGLWGKPESLLILVYLSAIIIFNFGSVKQFFIIKKVIICIIISGSIILLPFVISQIKPVFHKERTLILFLPIASILISLFVNQVGQWRFTIVLLGLLTFLSVGYSVRTLRWPEPVPARLSVKYVADHVNCGDTLIFGGLSLNETTYYLRRFNTSDCIQKEAFPNEIWLHPGWSDFNGLSERREELIKEARSLVARLKKAPGANVWFFYAHHQKFKETEDILRNELDRNLTLIKTLKLRGSFFGSVMVYAAPR